MSKKLNKRDIDIFTYEGGWDVRWDAMIPGFGVRIYPSGKKSYVLSYRHKNRKHLLTLGQVNKLALDQARDLALRNLAELADKIDPLDERRKKSTSQTVEKIFDEFIERYAKPKNKSWPQAKRIFDTDILPAIGKKAITDVSRQDIVKLLDGIFDRGSLTMANRTLAHVRKFFNWCVERGLIENSPVQKISRPAPEISRDRTLNDNEIREIWHASEQETYPFGPFIRLALATGQRRSEIDHMRWPDIDFDQALWTLPKETTKSNRRHTVPLSFLALKILETLPRQGDLIFSLDGETHYSNYGNAKNRLDAAILKNRKKKGVPEAMPHWRIHDLRRTAASGMAALQVAPHIIERILNHSTGVISGVAAVYNRYDYLNESRDALTAWAHKLESLIK